ncbi:MAG: short-chain dehydrogenase/reductase, partial [Mesorhizobium sp.]
RQEYANRLATWDKWDHVSIMAQGAKKNRKANA